MHATSGKVKEIFVAALKLAPDQWDSHLAEVCGDDDELRSRVRDLLHANAEAGSFLESPASGPAVTVDESPREGPGTIIGPYKLLEQIGEGGFGLVFMAEQQQPIRRKVALKILKPGMDTRQVIARFEAERQALALMDHLNIAKILDAGQTSSGRPYFVMDLVKGVPITEFCDQGQLTPRERLELFVHVCQAVLHAHQKGIIHRDLKPSNVLVTLHDGTPLVKVIDFGIAKALGQQLTDKTVFTGFAQLIGTPLYMAPEQAALSNVDVDTRSDIYSLGVLLYELLTGTTPFDKERLGKVDYDELRRIIREEEPLRPSTRISTLGQAATTVSTQRRSDPKRLSQLCRGELDWIVMKALEKDRNRRYETASGLARDVERYLKDEAVQACPPSAGYRLRKFVRRNKARLALATMVFCFIALLIAGGAWMMVDRAARQAKAANDQVHAVDRAELFQEQGKRAEALAALEQAELLESEAAADPELSRRLADLKARLAADQRDQEFIAAFEDIELRVQSGVNVEQNRFTVGAVSPEMREALHRYGICVTVMSPAEAAAHIQGRPEPVRRILVAALDECLRWAPRDHAQERQWLLDTLAAADSDPWRVRVRNTAAARDWKELEKLAHRADVARQPVTFLLLLVDSFPTQLRPARLELLRRIQRAYPADLWANHQLALQLMLTGKPAEAVRYYTAALALRPANAGIYVNRGNALRDAGEVDAAIADFRQALAIAPGYAMAHNNLGTALRDKRDPEGAIREFQAALKINPNDADAHCNLGIALRDKNDVERAMREFQVTLEINPNHARAHQCLGTALCDCKKDFEGAIREFRAALKIDPNDASTHIGLGNALYGYGKKDVDGAIREYQAALKIDPNLAIAHFNLGRALVDKKDREGAIREYQAALKINPSLAEAHCNLGRQFMRDGRFADALVALQTGHKLGSQRPGWTYPSTAWVREVEQLIELDAKLASVLKGKSQPGNAGERLQLAYFCQTYKQRYALAATWYAEAFAAEPEAADDMNARHRYNAACAAALAGCDQGDDAGNLKDEEKARLRQQALDWLRADLKVYAKRLPAANSQDRIMVQQQLEHWQRDDDLSGIRGSAALAKLPASESAAWVQLWADVESLLRNTRAAKKQ